MSNISYAQNFEDIMLYRSLGHVSSGFYIDVGANDPDVDSVTKKFYELGWRGINIEPTKTYFDKLEAARPRDINLKVIASNQNGLCRFYEIQGTGISTTEKDVSESHLTKGFHSQEIEVESLTLATICEAYVNEPVHFLKIDVEGGTTAVLEGMDLSKFRPWVILAEATKPLSQVEDYAEWEHLILSCSYEFVYADGLNRFYLAAEHAELREKFRYPPNVFDGIVLHSHQAQHDALQKSLAHADWLQHEKNALEFRLSQELAQEQALRCEAEARSVELDQELASVKQELSDELAQERLLRADTEARMAELHQELASVKQELSGELAQERSLRADGEAIMAALHQQLATLKKDLSQQKNRLAMSEMRLENTQAELDMVRQEHAYAIPRWTCPEREHQFD